MTRSQPSTPRTSVRPAGLRVGDSVTLPDGQTAILKFIGKIQGKPGEYAGVELIGEHASQGKHSGSFNGVTYFTTSQPNTGLFITYSKLIGANSVTKSPNTLRTPSLRSSGLTRPVHLPPVHSELAGPAQSPISPTRKTSSIMRPRRSLAGVSTINTLSPVKKPGAAINALTPKDHQSPTTASRRTRPAPATTSTATPSQRSSLLHSRRISIASEGGSGPAAAGASVEEFATLTRELREARNAISDKDAQLEHQSQILREMEQSLGELENIAMANGNRPDGLSSAQNGDIEALLRAVEEKDRKISSMKAEFEEKRKEFRETIDGLQVEIQETSELYESDIRSLKQNMGNASEVTARVVELEQIVASLESGLKSSQVSEQNARIQLSQLADVENRLLDKEQQIKDARLEIDHYKDLLEDAQRAQKAERRQSGAISQGIISSLQRDKEHLERELVGERDQVKDLEQKVVQLESTLNEASSITQDEEGKNIDSELIKSLELENEDLKRSLEKAQGTVEELHSQLKGIDEVKSTRPSGESSQLLQELDLYKSQVRDLEQEVQGLETMLEAKLFRETELEKEKELEALKLRSNTSSTATTFTSPTTPRTNETELTDHADMHNREATVYQSPLRVSDPASGRKLWCGLCEREGHESLDCPYEEEF
jgi:CAP-Gly domain